mmetsp:Transcript_17283/g.37492  ORF Transcript_17283/g.37492 Transcript_17283/m.37492 type:complete len:266 (+) Transcript_17283:807-1604(+)
MFLCSVSVEDLHVPCVGRRAIEDLGRKWRRPHDLTQPTILFVEKSRAVFALGVHVFGKPQVPQVLAFGGGLELFHLGVNRPTVSTEGVFPELCLGRQHLGRHEVSDAAGESGCALRCREGPRVRGEVAFGCAGAVCDAMSLFDETADQRGDTGALRGEAALRNEPRSDSSDLFGHLSSRLGLRRRRITLESATVHALEDGGGAKEGESKKEVPLFVVDRGTTRRFEVMLHHVSLGENAVGCWGGGAKALEDGHVDREVVHHAQVR